MTGISSTTRPDRETRTGGDALSLLDDYDFTLPDANIAQIPIDDREAARLLVLDRSTGRVLEPDADHRVRDLPDWLREGDLLVVNSTRVLPARLVGRKASGGTAEALLLGRDFELDTPDEASDYRALVKCTGRLRVGLALIFDNADRSDPSNDASELHATIVGLHERGEVTLRFEGRVDPYTWGEPPLPPYIRRTPGDTVSDDRARYQTIYAREPGAVAAPTAGLHFTPSLLERLRGRGIGLAEVILHVGAGTFRPLDASAFEEGRLHPERFELPSETCEAIRRTRAAGGRIVAVGTTTTRVLESQADEDGALRPGSGTTDLFLRPGGPAFKVVDALLTNFHLPRSSLLLLVAAFAGRRPILEAYEHAVREGFRFYSYGDAMLIVADDRRGPG